MWAIRKAILIACFMGVISTLTDTISPENSLKKHMMSVLGLIALLAVLSPFAADGFKLTLEDSILESSIASEDEITEDKLNEIFLAEAKNEYDEYFTALMNRNNIRTDSVDTVLELNENNELVITSVEIVTYDGDKESEIVGLIEEQISDVEIKVYQVENEGTDDQTDSAAQGQP